MIGARERATTFAMRAARSAASRTGHVDGFAEFEAIVDRGYGRNRRDDAATRSLLPVALPDGATGIDVGANNGSVLHDIVRVSPSGRHIAFEPVPALRADLERRFPGVDVRGEACSDRSGTSSFTVVTPEPALSGLRERAGLEPYADGLQRIGVDVVRLDDVIDEDLPVAFLKIDVEGAEVGVLRGAQQLLRRHRPTVVFEHGIGGADVYGDTSEELWDVLASADLRVFDLDGGGPYPRTVFAACFTAPDVWNWVATP
jgi:FkbM family methyltransferase